MYGNLDRAWGGDTFYTVIVWFSGAAGPAVRLSLSGQRLRVNINRKRMKEDLKRDPLVDFLVRARAAIVSNNKTVTVALVLLVFMVIVALTYNSMRRSSLRSAQDAFGHAMIAYTARDRGRAMELFATVHGNHGGTVHGAYSAYMLGTMLLEEGDVDDAIVWLERAAAARTIRRGFVGVAALEALATAYEHRGDYPRAIELFERVLREDRASYRRAPVRLKIALLGEKTGDSGLVARHGNELLADTSATQHHQKARNLLASVGMAP